MDSSRKPRCVFYSHDTMGFGHIRRNMLLCQAVTAACPEAEILLISGVREAGVFTLPPGADSLILPSWHKTPEGKYQPRALGKKIKPLVWLRAQIIYAAINAFSPDLMVVDNVPRGAMRELDLSLPLLAAKKTHLVLGLRDILDDPEAVKQQWHKQENSAALREFYSDIWVYGDRRLYDLRKEYNLEAAIKNKVTFTGYLDAARRISHPDEAALVPAQPYALCVVGGGQDGFRLAEAFVKAALPAGLRGLLVTGSMMPEAQRQQLKQLAVAFPEKNVLEFVAEPLTLLRHASCVVAMGGYNTLMEILACNKPALIVPRVEPREEQWIRAARLAELGLTDVLHPASLTPERLSGWLAQPHRFIDPREKLSFNGLEQVAVSVRQIFNRAAARESASCRQNHRA
ncbi:glycosyltransferase family protein [Kalamiella sp. sgz302252]|uniref:glycosyltransferase family protein n=1 Tax=Pantoea sp. sgz302252 TaxID=3341827 RepID=UPI0036D31A2E